MNNKVILLEDDDYDLGEDLPPALDLESMTPDVERTRRFRARAAARQLGLDSDVIEFFKTPEAINQALREVWKRDGRRLDRLCGRRFVCVPKGVPEGSERLNAQT